MPPIPQRPSPPPVIAHAGPLLASYDVLFCDVWGVVHNGQTAYVETVDALRAFRATGGTVILVTNAPRQERTVPHILAEKNVPPDCWDAIIPSGGVAIAHAQDNALYKLHHIGPDRDLDIFSGTTMTRVPLADAQAIFCTGLNNDQAEVAEDYRERLQRAKAQGLPFICANPDLVVDIAGTLLLCAGSIAALYESLGGDVYWAGKPYPLIYETAQARAQLLRNGPVDKSRILAIGDAVRTDIAGATRFGIDTLFIASGIHRAAVMPHGDIDETALRDLFAEEDRSTATGPLPDTPAARSAQAATRPASTRAAMTQLTW